MRCHSPHGECGLKLAVLRYVAQIIDRSLPAWGVRVEISVNALLLGIVKSLPAWGVRVEISTYWDRQQTLTVTPRMGSAG